MRSSNYEVIVTDDSTDLQTATLLQQSFSWVRYVRGPQRGPAANRNNGAKLALAPWLVFTDDDCLPDAQWLQAYADAIEAHPDCKAFEGAILPDDWELLKKDMAECPVNTTGGCFWSANIMVERELFLSIGGFDEQFEIAAQEDQELQWRIQQQRQILFVQQATVVHPVRKMAFGKRFKAIPIGLANWWKLSLKQQSVFHAFFTGLKSQSYALLANLKKRKWQSSILNITSMILLLPMLLFHSKHQ